LKVEWRVGRGGWKVEGGVEGGRRGRESGGWQRG
jgi:hypothetical protein